MDVQGRIIEEPDNLAAVVNPVGFGVDSAWDIDRGEVAATIEEATSLP
jgi:hypothetical protein